MIWHAILLGALLRRYTTPLRSTRTLICRIPARCRILNPDMVESTLSYSALRSPTRIVLERSMRQNGTGCDAMADCYNDYYKLINLQLIDIKLIDLHTTGRIKLNQTALNQIELKRMA